MPTITNSVASFLDFLKVGVDAGRVERGTLVFYQFQLAHLLTIATEIGDLELAQLTTEHLFRGPHSHHFVRAVRRLLRYHRLPAPPELTTPPMGQRQRTVSYQEFRKFRRHVAGQARWLLWVIYWCGCRPEEARELRWSQVFESRRLIRLDEFKARDRRRDGLRIRMIPLPPCVARVLSAWRRDRDPAGGDYVFVNRLGQPFTANALRCAVRTGRKRANMDEAVDGEYINAYSFRHTFATDYVRRNKDADEPVDVTLLADVMGHTDLSTTRRYLHRSGEDLVGAIDRNRRRRRGA